MKKRKLIGYGILTLILIIAFPLMLDWWVFGNDFPSNLSNGEWAGFLGSYIGTIVSGVCSVLSIVITVYFAKKELENSRQQFEAERINNQQQLSNQMAEEQRFSVMPVLRCIIRNDFDFKIADDAKCTLELLGNTTKGKRTCVVVPLEITNVGLGPAVNVSFQWQHDEFGELNYKITRNDMIPSGGSVIHQATLAIPDVEEFSFDLQIHYDDMIHNQYCKNVKFQLVQSEQKVRMAWIYEQDAGELAAELDKESVFYLTPKGNIPDTVYQEAMKELRFLSRH